MPTRSRVPSRASLALLAALFLISSLPTPVTAQPIPPIADPGPGPGPDDTDPNAWLEGVTDPRALDWVRSHNARTEAELATDPAFRSLDTRLRDVLDSTDKIPFVQKIGPYYYNFWKDVKNPRGLWRRTTLDEYRKPAPAWETVLDIDALNQAEKETWVWHGADCRRPDYTRCLLALSRGGSDADVTREFDLTSKSFVGGTGAFFRPEAKGSMGWADTRGDAVYVATDFGPGTLTTSGYPRLVKRLSRGAPMTAARTLYEGHAEDLSVGAVHDDTPGFERDFVTRGIAFYNDELYLLGAGDRLTKIDAPNSAEKQPHKNWMLLQLRDPWTVNGQTYPAGSLLAEDFDGFMRGGRTFDVLFAPTNTASLSSYTWTQNHLVLNVLEDVKNRLSVLTPVADKAAPTGWTWQRDAFPSAPALGTVAVSAVDPDESDAVWMTTTDYLTPSTLSLVDLGAGRATLAAARVEKLKTTPAFFDASTHVVEQHFATSRDGTRVPYFLVKPRNAPMDGTTPTLLYGYGGFEISLTPGYSGAVGRGWLEKGGAYAVANIRGGGEYGPRWHQAALKSSRHKAYEDFAAVAKDLEASRLTSPAHLGIQGGSNGGLLMGNMITQYPELFGAVVVQVPLLDMKRYSHLLAGASWMAEYGDPDTADWDYIKTFSPYQLFDPRLTYPPTIFLTSTRDDRVHPGHARKMMARMEGAGKDVRYYENVEGGHGGSADNKQAAHMQALAYTFLWKELSKGSPK